jgi:Tfp pilus assembly protein PilZ
MQKRSCRRFSIPGTVLYYKMLPRFLPEGGYSDQYYPVINMSRGGVLFVCDQRLEAGAFVRVKLVIPGDEKQLEMRGDIRWIAKNLEQSYRFCIGIAFHPYGTGKRQNPAHLLAMIKDLEMRRANR